MTTNGSAAPARGVTWRSILIGLILIWPNAWWVYMMEIVRYAGHPTTISLFFNTILVLLALICANALLRRVRPQWVFSQAEMLTIYIMLNISSAMVSHDFIQVLIPGMVHPFWFATAANRWRELIIPNLNPHLCVSNMNTLKGFYSGNDDFLAWRNLRYWLEPAGLWMSFIVVMVFSMLCLVALLRKQWTERERLAYPLVQLPLDMTAPHSSLFRNKLMWLGFGLAAALDVWNGFAFLYPQLPQIPIKTIDITQNFVVRPWSAIGWMPICFYPFAVGLGILLPLDLSFSCWFFFWVWKFESIISAVYGWDSVPGFPYVNQQSFGAYIGIAIFAFWASRNHFRKLFRAAVRPFVVYTLGKMSRTAARALLYILTVAALAWLALQFGEIQRAPGHLAVIMHWALANPLLALVAMAVSLAFVWGVVLFLHALEAEMRLAAERREELDDSAEPLSFRLAMAGFVLGSLYMMGFARFAGMSWPVIIAFFSIYWLLSLAITRMRAELGPPAHDLHEAGPDRIIAALVGPSNLSARDLTTMCQFFWFNRAYRSHPMPFQLEGFKMAERARMDNKRLASAMALAVVIGVLAAFWAVLTLNYKYGAATRIAPPVVPLIFGGEPFNRLDGWLKTPTPVDPNIGWAIVVGFALTIALNSLRMALPWFPFHPVGYAVSSTWSMHRLWICLFIAWLIKSVLLRYGGLNAYKKALPFFMGIILGECVIGGLWTVVGIALNMPTYAFWP